MRWVLSRGANARPFQGIAPRRRLLARTYCHLDLDQRRTLFRLVEARTPVGEIAARLGRHPSTIYRELGRNRFRDGDRGFCGYFPLIPRALASDRWARGAMRGPRALIGGGGRRRGGGRGGGGPRG